MVRVYSVWAQCQALGKSAQAMSDAMEISTAASELGGAEKLLSDLSSAAKGFIFLLFKL